MKLSIVRRTNVAGTALASLLVTSVMVGSLVVTSLMVGSVAVADSPADVSAPATRGGRQQLTAPAAAPSVANPALVGCDVEVVQALMEHDPSSSQWIVVISPSTTSSSATMQIVTVVNNAWTCSLPPTAARVGRNGIRPLVQRRSGDGTTPSGVFPLASVATPQGPVSFFGNSADPGARGAYRRVQPGDCYGARPNTSGYGHWRVDLAGCSSPDELLSSVGGAYEHAAIIGANTEPDVSGDAPGEIPYASAIFLHRMSYTSTGASKPTSGCVSVAHAALVSAIRLIDPALSPRFAIGRRPDLLALP